MAEREFGGLCENGHDVPVGARFCPRCGSPAHAPTDPTLSGSTLSGSNLGGPTAPGPPAGGGGAPYWWPGGPPSPPAPPGAGGQFGYGFPGYGGVGPGAAPAVPPYGPPRGWYGPPAAWPGPFGYPAVQAAGRLNGFAVASMVLGLLWLWWGGSVLAVVFGHVALRQIRVSGQRGRAMAIAGLVLGYLGLAVVAVVLVVLGMAS